MPTVPAHKTLNATSVDILNAIRNNASANYQNYVPAAQQNLESIREIGSVIMDYPALRNEFVSALVNRIGMTKLESASYSNPWAMLKKGKLNFGETIEGIFVNIAKAHKYDPETGANKVFAREIPDVRAAFYILNYQEFYKQTINNNMLRQAFLSWDGVTNLIAGIVEAMYTADATDEFLVMKYMIAKSILNGALKPIQISNSDIKGTVSAIKSVSNKWTFMNKAYNRAGVTTNTPKDRQYIIVNSDFDATMDVEVLAAAFNMSKADFMGHRILVDAFGTTDNERLAEIFKGNENYVPLTDAEMTALDLIPAVMLDENWFQIYDQLFEFTEQYNGENMEWNYWLHVWKVFGISPFAQTAVFVPGAPSITSVTVTPAAVSSYAGQSVILTASVETVNFASKEVDWTIETEEDITVSPLGEVVIGPDVTAGTYTITATSVVDSTKSDTCTLTVVSQS